MQSSEIRESRIVISDRRRGKSQWLAVFWIFRLNPNFWVLLITFHGTVDCNLVVLCFTSNIHSWVSTYICKDTVNKTKWQPLEWEKKSSSTPHLTEGWFMWDSPLYSMNMLYYHCLIKKMIWPVAGHNRQGKLNWMQGERGQSKRDAVYVAAEGERHQNLIGRPQPHGDKQINRNGLI